MAIIVAANPFAIASAKGLPSSTISNEWVHHPKGRIELIYALNVQDGGRVEATSSELPVHTTLEPL